MELTCLFKGWLLKGVQVLNLVWKLSISRLLWEKFPSDISANYFLPLLGTIGSI